MNRLGPTLDTLVGRGRKILSVYLTAGYPSVEMTIRLAKGLADAGADLLEIGIPFSDPLADGPVIQQCSADALAGGMTTPDVLSLVAEIRKSTSVPVILMGYVNPLLAYGMEKFMVDATKAGADGTIIPDLPLEESSSYRREAAASGIDPVFMITPTTPDDRIVEIDNAGRGFVYAVTVNGVTGERSSTEERGLDFIERARRLVTLHPLLAGFGISDPAGAKRAAGLCDGVIVGSAVMKRLRTGGHEERFTSAVDFVSRIRTSLDS